MNHLHTNHLHTPSQLGLVYAEQVCPEGQPPLPGLPPTVPASGPPLALALQSQRHTPLPLEKSHCWESEQSFKYWQG